MIIKLLERSEDGGPESHVWGYWLIEIKSLFSVALLRFEDGSREAFHSHAFNCISWVLSGELNEYMLGGENHFVRHLPSAKPVFTKRSTFHRVVSVGRTWVLTFRGPWAKTWKEYVPAENCTVVLKSGRDVVSSEDLEAVT